MPGIGELIDGAMQQAAQEGRQFMIVNRRLYQRLCIHTH